MPGGGNKVSGRHLTRAILILLFASSSAILGDNYWFLEITAEPRFSALIIAEILLFLGLSPETRWDVKAFLALPKKIYCYAHGCSANFADIKEIEKALYTSYPFHAFSNNYITSGLKENWREGSRHFLIYDAVYRNRKAKAIFAILISSDQLQADEVRAAIIDENENSVIFTISPFTTEDRDLPVDEKLPQTLVETL
jgi:hypothetical protein